MKSIIGAIAICGVVVIGAVAALRRATHKPCEQCGEPSSAAYFVPDHGIVTLCSTCDGLDGPVGIATIPGEFAPRFVKLR